MGLASPHPTPSEPQGLERAVGLGHPEFVPAVDWQFILALFLYKPKIGVHPLSGMKGSCVQLEL